MPPKILALVLLTLGLAMTLAAGLIAWGGINRWLAVGHLDAAGAKALAGDLSGARSAGREAMALIPGEAVAVLAAADLGIAENAVGLLQAARTATPSERAALAAAAGVALGKPAEGIATDPADQTLLQAIAAKSPAAVKLDPDHVPHLVVLTAWAASRLSAAWAQSRRSDIYEAASGLLTLAPRHPQAAELRLLIAALGPAEPSQPKLIAIAAEITDVSRRAALGKHLLALAPERTALALLIPGAVDPAAGEAAALAAAVANAKRAPASISETLVIRSLQAGRFDLADELIAAVDGKRQADLATLPGLLNGEAFVTDQARVSQPIISAQTLSFHLTNLSGALPTKAIIVNIGDSEVPSDQIRRLGTLIAVPLRVSGARDIRISYDGTVVYAANLTL